MATACRNCSIIGCMSCGIVSGQFMRQCSNMIEAERSVWYESSIALPSIGYSAAALIPEAQTRNLIAPANL